MARRTTSERGYGSDHQRLRAYWRPRVHAGQVRCARCGELIVPDLRVRGEGWDLGHDDADRRRYHGPEHAVCNRRAGGVRGNRSPLRRIRRTPGPPDVSRLRW